MGVRHRDEFVVVMLLIVAISRIHMIIKVYFFMSSRIENVIFGIMTVEEHYECHKGEYTSQFKPRDRECQSSEAPLARLR